MTEEQRIAAIDAIAEELLWMSRNYTWEQAGSETKEYFRRRTLKDLHALHSEDFLNAKDVYEFLVAKYDGPYWEDATEEQKLKCENAVQAMREVLEEEK